VGRSLYRYGYYYCTKCGKYVKAEELFRDRRGKLRHRFCGQLVRTQPKRPKKKPTFDKPVVIQVRRW